MHIKTTVFAAALALTANTAFAGGLSPAITETPVIEEAMVAPAGPSINPTYIVVGVLAALLVAAAVGSEDDNDARRSAEPTCDFQEKCLLPIGPETFNPDALDQR